MEMHKDNGLHSHAGYYIDVHLHWRYIVIFTGSLGTTDSSYYCTWTVLSQEYEIEGKIQERPIAYVPYIPELY